MASNISVEATAKPRLTLYETTTSGVPKATYILTPSTSNTPSRIDIMPPNPSLVTSQAQAQTQSLTLRLLSPFLPLNYPHSVFPDYTPYQIYDSLQAFASTIASLLASRAVLTSIGVGTADTSSSTTATQATILSILQESLGRLATILFAHRFSRRISAEVKFYRFLADIVNDVAFLLDVLSPSLPVYPKALALCAASACRAVCGVCGGSSKAILSAHFARDGNIGELNAKDGSQETVVSLVGMWVGGVVVANVNGVSATWCWMMVLLGVHLWANWMAVRSVQLRGLNRVRAGLVLSRVLQGRQDVSVEEVAKDEGVFERGDELRLEGVVKGHCCFGGVEDLLRCMGCVKMKGSGAYSANEDVLGQLLDVFKTEHYLLWFSEENRECVICLKDNANVEVQLKAWCHAMVFAGKDRYDLKISSMDPKLTSLQATLNVNSNIWKEVLQVVRSAGWDLSSSTLDVASESRICADIQ